MNPSVQAFFDHATNTVSYIVHDPATKKAAIIDPVLDFTPRTTTATEVANLQDLAALVVAQLEVRHEGLRTGEMADPMLAFPPQSDLLSSTA